MEIEQVERKLENMHFDSIVKSYCNKVNDIERLKTENKELNEQLRLNASSLQLPTKQTIILELENHQKKWSKCHTKKVNDTYALGFRHCYHFISDYVKGIR